MGGIILFCLPLLFVASTIGHVIPAEEPTNLHPRLPQRMRNIADFEPPEYWTAEAKASIDQKLNRPLITTRAKNLILMIGDGMGVSTLTAARILKGELDGMAFAEGAQHHMESFPYLGTSKTYCSDVQVADSACSSTAYSSGAKGNYGTLGLSPAVARGDCAESLKPENHVFSVLRWAQEQGMSTGIVTTTSITDASPAGFYAHSADRDWENDDELPSDASDCIDIAQQLILGNPGKDINVIMGGGREHFLDEDMPDPEESDTFGKRKDGKNLIGEWVANHANKKGHFIALPKELEDVDVENTDYLLGLFSSGNLGYLHQLEDENDPTIEKMTQVAIKILSKNPNGFYLFVEGGKIDKAHHDNRAQRALVETLEFDKAIKLVDDYTNDNDTLIVISADHSHSLTISGTPERGTPIFGFTGSDADDGLPVTTLAYTNGPGYRQQKEVGGECRRDDMTDDDVNDIGYRQMTTYGKSSAKHAGEDVLIFAKGPFAHLFTGTNDQTFIAHAMQYAAMA